MDPIPTDTFTLTWQTAMWMIMLIFGSAAAITAFTRIYTFEMYVTSLAVSCAVLGALPAIANLLITFAG